MFPPTATGLFWGAVFSLLLLLAAVTDIRERRIPNSGVLVLLVAGFAFTLTTRPIGDALSASLLGCVLGFGLFIAFWPMGVLGAGDVKLFAAIGAWLGPTATLNAALVTAMVGGVMALYTLAMRRMPLALSFRPAKALVTPTGNAAARSGHVPYGVAMAAGALVVAWLSPSLL